jgi:AraC family transcriptional regulator
MLEHAMMSSQSSSCENSAFEESAHESSAHENPACEHVLLSVGAAADPLIGSPLAAMVLHLIQTANTTLAYDGTAARQFLDQAMVLLRPRSGPARSSDPVACGLSPWQVRRLADIIEKNLEAPLKTAELARAVRLSTGYFCRAFKKSFGHAPHAYITSKRLQLAQRMMLTTDEPLSQIAAACGLADQSHLSRLFRRLMGQNPNAWRRAHKDGPPTIASPPLQGGEAS